MNAGIGLLLPWFILDLSTLNVDHVKRIHRYLPELRTPPGDPVADGTIVASISQRH